MGYELPKRIGSLLDMGFAELECHLLRHAFDLASAPLTEAQGWPSETSELFLTCGSCGCRRRDIFDDVSGRLLSRSYTYSGTEYLWMPGAAPTHEEIRAEIGRRKRAQDTGVVTLAEKRKSKKALAGAGRESG